MKVWIDAQLAPALADWLASTFAVEAKHIADLGLLYAPDPVIFQAAKQADAIVMTNDRDFVEIVRRLGPPPQIFVGYLRKYFKRQDATALGEDL